MTYRTLPSLLIRNAEKWPDKIALREKEFGIFNDISWLEYLANVKNFALGLLSIGFKKDDKVAIIGDNRPEWIYAEMASQSVGSGSVGIYQDSILKEISYIINNSDSTIVVAEDQEQVDKLLDMKHEIKNIKKIVFTDPKGMRHYNDDLLIYFPDFCEDGKKYGNIHKGIFEQHVNTLSENHTAQICTTSGTTGIPKLAMLSHRNLITMAKNLGMVDPKYPTDEFVSFLPLSWVGEQMMAVASALFFGFTVNFPEEPETAQDDFREIGPNFMFSPPRVWENLAASVQVKISNATWLKRKVFHSLVPIGYRSAELKFKKLKASFFLKTAYRFADFLLFRPLRDRMGFSNIRSAMTGGAALGPDTFKFFHALGINLKQIYGQTEISGISCIHRNDNIDPDTMGAPLPETEIKIIDGEICSKSPALFQGYYQNEKATSDTLIDGWLHSGDAGYLTDDGQIVVIDRLKDLMKLADETKFSPQFIENKLKFSPYIKEAVVFGNNREYIAVLINIDYEIVGNWAEKQHLSYTTYTDLASKKEVYGLIEKEVKNINNSLKKEMRIAKFTLLYKELDADDGELTRTKKVRRHFIGERYSTIIKALYSDKDTVPVDAEIKFQDGKTAAVHTELFIKSV